MTDKQKKTSKELLDQLTMRDYKNAYLAKLRGEPVGWLTSIFPQELVETFGLSYVYPENHCSVVSARKDADHFIQAAEDEGYSNDLCAYARLNFGFSKIQESAALTIPMPDFICCCNNICNEVIKWYENLAKELDIPMILIDVAYSDEYEISQAKIDYIKGQFEHAISQLEKVAGKPFDCKRFSEIMHISNENSKQWKAAVKLMSEKPCPMNGFDLFNYMALIVCGRGKATSHDVFELLEEENRALAASGRTKFLGGEEKQRIMWDGIAVWPYLSYTVKTLLKYGINMSASTYPDAFAILYEDDSLEGMAKAYAEVGNNLNMERQIKLRSGLMSDMNCTGAVYHMNRSCKIWDMMQYSIARQVAENTGTPYTIFDGDQSDARAFSKAQYATRIQGLAEVMASGEEVKK